MPITPSSASRCDRSGGDDPRIGPHGEIAYTDGTQRRIGYISEIPMAAWRLVTTVDEAEIRAPILQRLAVLAGMLFASSLAMTLVLAVLWQRRVMRPLALLLQRLRALSATGSAEGLAAQADDGMAQIAAAIESTLMQTLLARNAQLDQANQQISALNQTLAQRNVELVRQATLDGLTGIPNRRTIDAHLVAEHQRFQRHGTPFSVIMFDIDHFKAVNDVFGHQAGDDVLRELARIVSQRIRTTDVVGRWGGEEFLIVVRNGTLAEAQELAEQLRARVAAHAFPIDRPVTISLGVAQVLPHESIEHLVGRADAALYQAKHGGRNQVCAAPSHAA